MSCSEAAGAARRCPLCYTRAVAFVAEVEGRTYHRCRTCLLTFLEPGQRPTLAEERAKYDLHRNNPADPRYRAFLARLASPLCEGLPAGSSGLDFAGLESAAADEMMAVLASRDAETLRAVDPATETFEVLDYVDPVSGDRLANARLRVSLKPDARITCRLSGTGSSDAALRIYIERIEPPGGVLDAAPSDILAPLAVSAVRLIDLPRFTGRTAPTSVS